MKKIVQVLLFGMLSACSSVPELGKPQAPLDMNTVEKYNSKVYSGKTTAIKVAEQPVNMPLNTSDSRPKREARATSPVILMPSIGYHYGHYRYRHW